MRRTKTSQIRPLSGIPWSGVLLLLVLFVMPGSLYASIGTNWLVSQINADGSIATAADIGTPVQSTSETLRALQVSGVVVSPTPLTFLNAEPFENTEYLARRIIANVNAGNTVAALVTQILPHQNADGGFGDLPGYSSTTLDTAFALQALAAAGQLTHPKVAAGVSYLVNRQSAGGGWKDGENADSVYLTALALSALTPYASVYAISPTLNAGRDWLYQQQLAGGGWASPWETSLALKAVVPVTSDISLYANAVNGLRAAQSSNGAWSNDVFITALALQALILADNPPPNPTLSTLRGQLVDADTGLALSGVSVVLSGGWRQTLITGNDGSFIFRNLAPANYSMASTLANYTGLTISTTTRKGQITDLGAIALSRSPNATTGTVRGTITDGDTGAPLPDVSVSVTGIGSATVTDSAGGYQLTNVSAGSITIQAAKAGYSTSTASAIVVAGGIVVFSTSLTPVQVPITGIKGTVTDGALGIRFTGVAVSVTGATSASTMTDRAGSYELFGLTPGPVMITLTYAGYDPVSAPATIFENNILEFSPTLYPENTSPENANSASVTGIVLDAADSQPLAGVNINAEFGGSTHAALSGSDGRFAMTGINQPSVGMTFSLINYQGSALTISLAPATLQDIGQIRLRRESTLQLLPDLMVEGVNTSAVVTDLQTLAIAGVVSATVVNQGVFATTGSVDVLVFHDTDMNGAFDGQIDTVLGHASLSGVAGGGQVPATIPVTGNLPFQDAPISVWVDSGQTENEINETNNVTSTSSACAGTQPDIAQFSPVLKWHWNMQNEPGTAHP